MDSLGAGHSIDTFSLQDVLIFISYTAYYTRHIRVGLKCDCFVHCRHVMSLVAISVRVSLTVRLSLKIPRQSRIVMATDMHTVAVAADVTAVVIAYQGS